MGWKCAKILFQSWVRSSQKGKGGRLHYPTAGRMSDKYSKHMTEPQKSSKTPGGWGVGQGPPANLSSPIPVAHSGSDHGLLPQEGGGVGVRPREKRHSLAQGFMPTASSLRTIPHHPGCGKCSWSLLVGCKGKKNPS